MIREEYRYDNIFHLENGGQIEELSITYHRSDRPYVPGKDGRKVVWICHAFTANSDRIISIFPGLLSGIL